MIKRGAQVSFLFAVNNSDIIYSRYTLDKLKTLCYNQPRGGGGERKKWKKEDINLLIIYRTNYILAIS